MPGEEKKDDRRGLRYDDLPDPEFQKKWREARKLEWDQVELAFRHGLEAIDRFADRPFDEVADYLRQSWEGMGAPVPWDQVADIVRSGYERYRAGAFGDLIDLAPEAAERFEHHTSGGSFVGGGPLGDRTFLGSAEPVAHFEGEGGPPVEDGKRVTSGEE